MKDLTRGSIVSHILTIAPPIVAGMITIMICQLVDLYFVSAQCTEVGKAVTQDSNEVGLITTPARYVVILLAFNATGSPSVTVNWSTP